MHMWFLFFSNFKEIYEFSEFIGTATNNEAEYKALLKAVKWLSGSTTAGNAPFFVVRAKGLEPPHLAMPEPKSGASTNSATPAYEKLPFHKRREPLTGKPR